MSKDGKPVTIIMIEDDEGHARLIEKNIRRAGVNNQIIPFTNGTDAMKYLMGPDGEYIAHFGHEIGAAERIAQRVLERLDRVQVATR